VIKLIAILFITSSFFHSNALAMSCVELVGMIVPKPKVEATVKDSNGQVYRVRAAIPEDIPAVTLLIRNAFEIWKREGLSLSPMIQTDLQTARHLVDKGFVAENSAGELVGTFSLDKGSISRDASGSIQFIEGDHQPISFSAYDFISIASSERLLVFKKAAVRLAFTKDTGGLGEALVLFNEGFQVDGTIPMIVNRGLQAGRTITVADHYRFTVLRQEEQKFFMRPEFDAAMLPDLLAKHGTTPTPPYLGEMTLPETALRERYQTVFAKGQKSVAAPTASLHFTDRVFASLDDKKIERTEVTLDVGLGTFQDVKQENVDQRSLHSEPFHVPAQTIAAVHAAKTTGRPVIAVGTTAVRTLEANAQTLLAGKQETIVGTTNLFIMSPYPFAIVDIMMTNFHVPQSSLMALVDAFLAHKGAKRRILDLYAIAQREGFQFFSFGDSMLIL
jgi:S-adenosylmethionine:tRNA ribosyltransferase-isomerase